MKHILFSTLVLLIAFTGRAQTFTWNGQMPIFDFTTDTIPIPVSGLPVSIDTNFGIAHICFDITHTYDNDLVIKLFSPAGDSVILIQGIGGAGDNFLGTCVGMDGTHFSNTTAPYSGIFVPIGNVAAFNNGQNPNGIWRCTVYDGAGADTGSVHMVSISFVNNPPRQGSAGTGPVGTYICPTCVCPGGASACDLLPDMTASAKEIQLNHTETPGALYIANATPNIGYGPLEIYGIDSCFCGTTHVPCGTICPGNEEIKQVIKQRIYQKVAGTDTLSYYDRFAGTMTFHPTHGHLHVDDFANFTLRSATSNPDATTWPIIGTGTKQSFCLINLGTCAGNYGECTNGSTIVTTVPNQGLGYHTGCGLTQGIYAGSYDVYSMSLNDPIPLTNVCNGTYYIVSITDPNDNFLESDETNNWVAVPITLTQQGNNASISASGPLQFCPGDSVILTSTFSPSYLWSTGETTPSIVVSTSGSYTVSVSDGLGCTTESLPVVVTVHPLPAVPVITASGPTTFCQGQSVTLTSSSATGNVWSTGATTQSIVVNSTQNITLTVTDSNLCSSVSQAIQITVNPLPAQPTITASGSPVFCSGETIDLTSSPADFYSWNPGSANTQTLTVSQSGSYTVTITDSKGCTGTDQV
ncbi:MAG TPA: proprotein convertase P-domain-containing protein, partial [Chitinophagaceae bacterium]|nr:proprotein convertase P-domain-containing protein [Chitinophagaceae bacterium]